jgi:hypothetical protein
MTSSAIFIVRLDCAKICVNSGWQTVPLTRYLLRTSFFKYEDGAAGPLMAERLTAIG